MTLINVICSMCNKLLGTKDGKGISGDSHGLCSSCLQEVLDSIEESRHCSVLPQQARQSHHKGRRSKRFFPYIKSKELTS